MNKEDIRAIVAICLLASFCDGEKHDREREQIRQVAEGLTGNETVNLAGIYQDVLLRRITIESAVASLTSYETRQLAYEMAVCVCDADGRTSEKEEAFLKDLRQRLFDSNASSTPTSAQQSALDFQYQAQQIADAPLQGSILESSVVLSNDINVPHPTTVDQLSPASDSANQRKTSSLSNSEMDSKILKASVLNGAIELLPENLSTLAIIPLQTRLVYQIGQSYGYSLDKGHIKDFLATVGVGLTSQYLEQVGRKLLGGLLGKGLFGGVAKQAVSSGMSFASTYALGHVANQYYAGNRQFSTELLKQSYQRVMQEGKTLQNKYGPEIQKTASGLNTAKILSMVRGQNA